MIFRKRGKRTYNCEKTSILERKLQHLKKVDIDQIPNYIVSELNEQFTKEAANTALQMFELSDQRR